MKKHIKLLVVLGIILVGGFSFYLFKGYKKDTLVYENNKVKPSSSGIAMMLETSAGSGNYEMTTRSEWPTEGYVFNAKLSKCENGSELSWDNENKKVLMSGNKSDKCYVYFDVYVKPRFDQSCNDNTLACHTAKLYTGTQGANNIYYHDASLTNGANDNSYRFAGASDAVNNYVCFGSTTTPCPTDNLYRIIGVFGDKVKLIKSTSVGNKAWDSNSSNTWSTSSLNTYLNNDFLNVFDETIKGKIDTTTWKVGGNTYSKIRDVVPSVAYQNEIVSPVKTNTTDNATDYSAKVGLMYASDYGFAAAKSAWTSTLYNYYGEAIKSANWMYLGSYEWTISRSADLASYVFRVYDTGGLNDDSAGSACAVRPVFYLSSSVNYASGSGSATDPIVVN